MTANQLDKTVVLETLRQVIDPEIGCNIVDLGLIYGVEIENSKVRVAMTFTTRGCPMHERLCFGVQTALLNLDEVDEVEVELVQHPPWTPAMMTDKGRAIVGAS